ncbi:hypothetical protein Mapa_017052 [Marchantia paleacea]|nr:hypothetical protein Mapa_017052 [Marchantia paleacea]
MLRVRSSNSGYIQSGQDKTPHPSHRARASLPDGFQHGPRAVAQITRFSRAYTLILLASRSSTEKHINCLPHCSLDRSLQPRTSLKGNRDPDRASSCPVP